MAYLNKIQIIGNLTRDPEIRHTPAGIAVADIGIAINRKWKDKEGQQNEDVTFVDVTLWSSLAELAGKYLSKGSSVYVEGRLEMDSWEDKETGAKRSKLKIVGENIQFLGGRPDSSNQSRSLRAEVASPEPENVKQDALTF